MPRKLFLDGDANGNRPSPIFALVLCLIPIATFLYMKRRQGQRFNQLPDPGRPVEETTEMNTGSAESQRVEQERKREKEAMNKELKRQKDAMEKAKKEWDQKIEDEKKKVESERKKRNEVQASLSKSKRELKEAADKMVKARFEFDQKLHPNDPFLNDPTPEEVYDTVGRKVDTKAPAPGKGAMRPAKDGQSIPGYQQKPKGIQFLDDKTGAKHPVQDIATYRRDRHGVLGKPGINKHDGVNFVPADQRDGWYNQESDKANKKFSARNSNASTMVGLDVSLLQQKTEELGKFPCFIDGGIEIFQAAVGFVAATPGSAQYDDALQDRCHDDFGMYPAFATPPIEQIVALLEEDDVKKILRGVAKMKDTIKRNPPQGHPNGKDPDRFLLRHCMEQIPDKQQLVVAWFIDSFRLVPSRVRMNVIRGPPENMETVLGFKYQLLEWLEIFGTLCGRQRLLSRRGFDFPGLCVRLHCLPRNTPDRTWKLNVSVFLPGGPDKLGKGGKPLETWESRLKQAGYAWTDIWPQLISETAAYGTQVEGYQAFAEREIIFCPGYTFEGLGQANGLSADDHPPRGPDAGQPTRYDPILNAFHPPEFPSPGPGFILKVMAQPFGLLRATKITFLRRRQHSWSTASLTEQSHDFKEGTVAMCLALMERVPDAVQHVGPGDEFGHRATSDYDCVEAINFGSTIPMTINKADISINRFPDLTGFHKLNRLVMAYVPVTRDANGEHTFQSRMPATAVLVLCDKLGLKPLLQRNCDAPEQNNKFRFFVDMKEEHVQQLADELYEELVMLAKEGRPGWTPTAENINKDAKENTDIIRQIYWEGPDQTAIPITHKIPKITWGVV